MLLKHTFKNNTLQAEVFTFYKDKYACDKSVAKLLLCSGFGKLLLQCYLPRESHKYDLVRVDK